jgi:hypothetical protein
LEKDTKNPKKKHQEIQRLIFTITQNQSKKTIKPQKNDEYKILKNCPPKKSDDIQKKFENVR